MLIEQAGAPADYANEFEEFEDDVLGEDSDDEDDMYSYRKKKKKKKDAEQESAFMVFDFRKGPTQWPEGCELVDAQKASDLLEKVIFPTLPPTKDLRVAEYCLITHVRIPN